MKPHTLLLLCVSAVFLHAGSGLPLPPAPLRVVIPDVKAFDAALEGDYRSFLRGQVDPGDPLISAWRKTQLGSKLEDQWIKFSGSMPLTWDTLLKLQPRAIGLALLDVGNLEAVLVVDSPLAELPLQVPQGRTRTHAGIVYTAVVAGAGDASEDPDHRMGLAWARKDSRFFLATSERALKLALEEAMAGREVEAPMEGLVSMDLDLDALRKDRYFRREFPFEPGPEGGHLRTALRQIEGQLVEVREGTREPRHAVPRFTAPGAAAAGWEPEGTEFWPTFRRGLLEPIPAPSDLPLPAIRFLPSESRQATEDRYGVDFTRPRTVATGAAFEKGDLEAWSALLTQTAVLHWGYWVGTDGARRMVFPWPEDKDAAFLETCRLTVARRAGKATAVKSGSVTELHIGPGLPALAVRRTGGFLWVGPTAASLKQVPTPHAENGLIRWAQVDLEAVRREGERWNRVEGPGSPEQVRPFSDRVLGLVEWMPATKALSVERHKTAKGWKETVRFKSSK